MRILGRETKDIPSFHWLIHNPNPNLTLFPWQKFKTSRLATLTLPLTLTLPFLLGPHRDVPLSRGNPNPNPSFFTGFYRDVPEIFFNPCWPEALGEWVPIVSLSDTYPQRISGPVKKPLILYDSLYIWGVFLHRYVPISPGSQSL